ncbi:MAG: hypothetical protein HYT35_00050 [Candidatus Staskawiczbacteria bacterium]|nr:hypothetical protein [Candidatus Staskawiczbacteria bacterium]
MKKILLFIAVLSLLIASSTAQAYCSSSYACGNSEFVGGPYCQGNSAYQLYKTYTCNNPGAVNSYCSSSTTSQLRFNCSGNQTCYNGECASAQQQKLIITESVKNISKGNSNWAPIANANPLDILEFRVQIQSVASRNIGNITLRSLPETNLQSYQNLTLDGYTISGNITSGITVGSVSPNQTRTVAWRAQIIGPENFSSDPTTLNNLVEVASTNSDYSQTGPNPVYIYVSKAVVSGVAAAPAVPTVPVSLAVTTIPTGFTDNFFTDSFFLPLLIALTAFWLYKSGLINIEAFLDRRKEKTKNYIAKKNLESKITKIKEKRDF